MPVGYIDSDFQSDPDSRKSTLGLVFTLNGGAIERRSMKQSCIFYSTIKVEYVTASEAVKKGCMASHQINCEMWKCDSMQDQIGLGI